jgi:hypothetical protein
MADYPISNVPRRVQYVNSGVGPYAFTFEILVQTDIAVYRGNTLLTLTTDYTVTINANGTGSITLVTAGTGNITIVGARAIQRSSDYTTGGDLFASTLNTDLDSQTIYSQQLAETLDRTIKVPVTDASTLNMQLPSSTTRANKVFGFDSNGAPQASTNTLAAIDAAVDTIESIASAPSGNSAGISHIASGLGAVATTVQTKLRESVSVRDFGAVGDGIVDDTAAIQAAFDAISSFSTLTFAKGGIYKTTAELVMPQATYNVTIQGNGAVIRAMHNGNGLVLNALNENYSRFKVYDLIIQGPNVSFPSDATLAGTSTGAGLVLGFNNTSNFPVACYLSSFINCEFNNFYQGVYLQQTLLTQFVGCSMFYNQYGIFIDGSLCNANKFTNCSIRQNRVMGLYSSGRTGGTLTPSTNNVFTGCIFESNVPYKSDTWGGYDPAFDPTTGYGVRIQNSFMYVFDSCYFENHNYSVVVDGSSDDNQFLSLYIAGSGSGSPETRPGATLITSNAAYNNTWSNCRVSNTTSAVNVIFDDPSVQLYNQFLDNSGFVFDSANIHVSTYIRNSRKVQGTGTGQFFGLVRTPYQGYIDNPPEGTAPGTITGIGTATATMNVFGVGEVQLTTNVTAATTITAFSGLTAGQFLVIRNYQNSHAVTLESAANGTGAIVLAGFADAVFNNFGQQIVLYVTSGLGGNRAYEVGRNF